MLELKNLLQKPMSERMIISSMGMSVVKNMSHVRVFISELSLCLLTPAEHHHTRSSPDLLFYSEFSFEASLVLQKRVESILPAQVEMKRIQNKSLLVVLEAWMFVLNSCPFYCF